MNATAHRSFVARLAGGLLVAALVLGAATVQAGQETSVNSFSGALFSSVPIAVPGFRGLEPQVAIGYNSQAGSGNAGVGWGLQGISVIERGSPGMGVPRYDGSDVYFLDGTQLIPCSTFGGSYCTRVESYQRITVSGSYWYVTARDGTKSTYSPVFSTASGTVRWGLTSRQDTMGNTVSYTWWSDGSYNAYPSTITYNGTTVKFYWELRTDIDSFATGAGMGQHRYRLKTVDVTLSGSRVRVYKLTYSTSYVTQRSYLYSVQQLGTNASVDASGNVSGGTGLPAMTMSMSGGSTGMYRFWGNPTLNYGMTALKWLSMDVNGDGKTDLVKLWNGTNLAGDIYTSTGCGLDSAWSSTNMGSSATALEWLTGDVNGDGKADIIQVWNNGGKAAFVVHAGAGTAPAASFSLLSSTTTTQGYSALKWLAGDVNGDGKTDVVQVFNSGGYTGMIVHLSNGSGFTTSWSNGNMGTTSATTQWLAGDVNGDGRLDVIQVYDVPGCYDGYGYPTCYTMGVNTYLSNGSGYVWASGADLGGDTTALAWLPGDYNGDGKTDIIKVFNSGGNVAAHVYASNGKGFQYDWGPTSLGYTATGGLAYMIGDVNGDGRSDIIQTYDSNWYLGMRVFTSRGTSYAYAWGTTNIGHGRKDILTWLDGDINGDGTTDLMLPWTNGSYVGVVAIASYGRADLLSTQYTGLGGYTSVSYTPSTSWTGNQLPQGMVFPTVASVSVSDGRGDIGTTNYAYTTAKWNAPDREFLGFRKATKTLTSTGSYAETYYWQRAGTIAKPEVIYKRKANGAIMSFEKFVFTEDAAPPYTSLVTQIMVDPIMADNGILYNGIDEERIPIMRELISKADLTIPNITEAYLLLENRFNRTFVDTKLELKDLVDGIRGYGSKSVIITSVKDGNENHYIAGYDHKIKEYFKFPYNIIDVTYPGTGDIFSAIVLGYILKDYKLQDAAKIAADFIYNAISKSEKLGLDRNEGINLELYINSIK